MVLDQYKENFHGLQRTFSLYTNIPWYQLSKLYSGRVNCYMPIKYEEKHYPSFRCREGS